MHEPDEEENARRERERENKKRLVSSLSTANSLDLVQCWRLAMQLFTNSHCQKYKKFHQKMACMKCGIFLIKGRPAFFVMLAGNFFTS